MKKNTLNYLISILFLYSIYDYFEHIKRPNSIFEQHPYYWLAFNIGAFSTLVITTYGFKYLLEKLFKIKNLLIEVVAIGVWIIAYINVFGELINKLLWPFDQLIFSFRFGPFMILLIAYFIIRVVVNLIIKKPILYSK